MIRIGYAPSAYDLFHVGHLHLLRRAKAHCDLLIAGVVDDADLAAPSPLYLEGIGGFALYA